MRRLQGIYPALITPFTHEGLVDESALVRLVEFHAQKGTDGLFVCGSLGSGPAMSVEERRRVAEVCAQAISGRMGLIVHVGALNPSEATALAAHAESIGADAVAAIPPYYYRVTWPVVRGFYDRLLDAIRLPVWAYNNPHLVHFEFTLDNVLEMAGRGVRGYKDSALSHYQFQQVLLNTRREEFTVFTAVPSMLFAALVAGADGFVGGPNNALPQFYNELYAAVRAGDWGRAVALERRAGEVFRLCGGPLNVPMWQALLSEFGVEAGLTRMPILPITEETRAAARASAEKLRAIMQDLEVPW